MTAHPPPPLALALLGLVASLWGWGAAGVPAAGAAEPATLEVAAPDTVLVARRDLARATVLQAADIDTLVLGPEAARTAGVALAVSRRQPAERVAPGWITRRTIRAGEPLQAPAVVPPPLIPSGALVTVVWEHAGLRVTRAGTALGEARRGERVLVRVDAQRRVSGIATEPGVVLVATP